MPREKTATLSRSAIRRQRERKERLETILAAAETFFAREGYHKTSMERIADEAEMSVGSLYFYFKNKEDLLIKLLEAIGIELRLLLAREFNSRDGGDGFDGLRRASKAFFEKFCTERPDKLAIIFRESVGQSAEVELRRQEILEKIIGDLKSALSQLSGSGEVALRSDRSLDIMAAGILGTYERVAYHSLLWRPKEMSLEAVSEEAVEFIIGGIRNLSNGARG